MIGLLTLIVGLVAWTGCDSSGVTPPEENGGNGEEGGQVRILLTDAPADLAEANVTVQRVEAVPSDGSPIVLTDRDTTLNLLELQNGVTATLADTTLPAGTYSQLRFIVADTATVTLTDGSVMDLKVPSGAETGIKINLPSFEVASGQDMVEITLDFSVEDSFVRAGRSGKYIFKPVVKAEEVEVNGEAADLLEMSGAVSSVDADSGTVAVDSIEFAVTENTEIEGENEGETLASLASDLFVNVSATRLEDGTLAAREIEAQDEGEEKRSVDASIEAVSDSSVTVLGVAFTVDEQTELDGVAVLDELQSGDPVELTYDLVDGTYVALKIETDEQVE